VSLYLYVWLLYAFTTDLAYTPLKDHKNMQPSAIFYHGRLLKQDHYDSFIGPLHCLFQALFCDDAPVAASNRYVAPPQKYLY
jgi:hypothetical protein